MVKLMTHGEVERRLSLDHDPLDLSIEKWERLLEAVETGQKITRNDLWEDTCALCLITPTGGDPECEGCLYYEHWGQSCEASYSHFTRAWHSYFKPSKTSLLPKDAFREMIQALKEVKANQE
jgi:hypothetical protein